MADLNIAIKIAAQDQASGVLGRIGGALKGMTSETGLAGRGFGGLQTAVSGLMMGGMTLLLGGMVAVGGAAFGMANDVQAATALVQGQLGLGVEEAQAYGDVIRDVYGANFGESVAAVGTAVGEVSLQLARMGEVGAEAVQSTTINALRLSDAFGVDVAQSTNAAVALMSNFGLSGQEAFDFITTGFQRGLNSSGDFLDSIGEYSTQFSNGGATASQFFSLMETGMMDGMLGTDKAADAFKEFRVRLLDGSSATQEAAASLFGFAGGVMDTTSQMGPLNRSMLQNQVQLEGLIRKQAGYSDSVTDSQRALDSLKISELTQEIAGQEAAMGRLTEQNGQYVDGVEGLIDFEGGVNGFFAALSDGSLTTADAFEMVIGALQGIEDPAERMQVGVALLGTQFEDLGDSAIMGLSLATTSLEDMAGATEGLDVQYQTLGSALEGFKRQALVALEPIGAVLLTIANFILPYVQQGVEAVGPIFERVGAVVSQFLENLDAGITPVAALSASLATMVSPEVADQFDAIVAGVQGFLTTVGEVLAPVAEFVTSNVQLSDVLGALGIVVASIVLPALAGIVVAAAPVLLVAAALIAGIALLRTAWEGNWGGIQEKTAIAVDFVKGVVSNGIEAIKAWWAENGDAIMAKALEIWTTVSTHVNTGIETAKTIISTALETIKGWWAENGDTIMAKALEIWTIVSTHVNTGIETAKTIISTALETIKGWWAENGDTIMAKALEIWTTVSTHVSTGIETAKTIISTALEAIKGWWSKHGDDIIKTATSIWKQIQGAFEAGKALVLGLVATALAVIGGDWELAKEAWRTTVVEAWGRLEKAFFNGLSAIGTAVTNAWPEIKTKFETGLEEVKTQFTSVDWGAVATSVITSIAGAFSNGVGILADAARAAAQAALDAALGLLGGGSGGSGGSGGGGGGGNRGALGVGGGASGSGLLAPLSSARFGVPALAGVGALGGGGGGGSAVPSSQIIYNVTVDARGSSASAAEIERAVERALRKAGATADQRMRAGVK